MIVFISEMNLMPAIYNRFAGAPVMILNLSSCYSGFGDVTNLITNLRPLNTTGQPMPSFVESVSFDIQYANAVLSDNMMFCSLMNIMLHSCDGRIVVILVARDHYRDSVMESLIKLIQQRYGYDSWIVENIEDVDCLKESNFTPQGLLTLDADMNRFQQLYISGAVSHVMDTISIE